MSIQEFRSENLLCIEHARFAVIILKQMSVHVLFPLSMAYPST